MTFTVMSELYRSIGKTKKCTFIFCADHGVAEMKVSAYPQSTTAEMVKNYLVEQGAAANVFAKFAHSELVVVDVGVNADISDLPGLVDRKIDYGTKNIVVGKAMTKAQAKKSIKIGKELAEKAIKAGCNCFLLGEMGIANTTVASAITAAFFDTSAKRVTGRGSNISDARLKNKIKVVGKAVGINFPDPDDPIDVLSKVGGFEFGAMAGVILAAAKHNCVVVLDGFNTAVAALIAYEINSDVNEHLIASHIGREVGHDLILNYLDLMPMFTLDLALGEAIGSSIAVKILDCLNYVYVCGPDADFEGDLSDFKENSREEEFIKNIMENLNLDSLEEIDNIDKMADFLNEAFDGQVQVEEVDLDFQLSDDERLDSFEPPFSVHDFNIPRAYPMMLRSMGGHEDEYVAASEKTFNFYLQTMPKLDYKAMNRCREHIDKLAKPYKSLGLLEDIAIQFAGITGEEFPTYKFRRAAFALTDMKNTPPPNQSVYRPHKNGFRRNVTMDFSMSARTFAMKIFMGLVDSNADPTVAFNFGRNLAEEISFGTPVIAMTDLSDWEFEKLDKRFSKALLKKNGNLKVDPNSFLNAIPKDLRCLTSALIGAIISAAHNSTLIVLDSGPIEIIARYLEKICPEIRPFLLYATKLTTYDFEPDLHICFDGEIAFMGVEIVEAALMCLNEMKTFSETGVKIAIDGKGAENQIEKK